jgi:hypothetical protein
VFSGAVVRRLSVSSQAEARKEAIILELIEARACILAAASGLPVEKQDEFFLGVWSVKDLLAHLVGWDYTNIEAAKEIQEGKLPSFYDQYDRGWRSYNAKLVKEYRREDFGELVSSVEESHRELVEYLRGVPAEEFDKDRGIRAGRWKVTIARLLEVEAKDEWEHCRQIKEFGTSRGTVQSEGA